MAPEQPNRSRCRSRRRTGWRGHGPSGRGTRPLIRRGWESGWSGGRLRKHLEGFQKVRGGWLRLQPHRVKGRAALRREGERDGQATGAMPCQVVGVGWPACEAAELPTRASMAEAANMATM